MMYMSAVMYTSAVLQWINSVYVVKAISSLTFIEPGYIANPLCLSDKHIWS